MERKYINSKEKSRGLKQNEYDVAIIGAGIGALVCGCYLAKDGLKVIIIEQHKIGGYCQSFARDGFTFEAGALENLRKGGEFRKIIDNFDIEKKVKIIRCNPSMVLITPDYKIKVTNNSHETLADLQNKFPHEAQRLSRFFDYIFNTHFSKLFLRAKNKIFKDLLDEYFVDKKLKAIFNALIAQIGVPSERLSTLTAIIHLREFVFDGGYYPMGGLHAFANAFAEKFQELGGQLLLGKLVTKIKVSRNQAEGVFLQDKTYISAKYIVSNADATQTFLSLVGEENLRNSFIVKLKKLIPSISILAVYLGISRNLKSIIDNCYELCYMPRYKEDNPWDKKRLEQNPLNANLYCYFLSFRDESFAPKDSESISVGMFVPPMNRVYWDQHKHSLADRMIERMEELIPGLSKCIVRKEIATPLTFHKYTLNKNGAMRGWAAFSSQIDKTIMPQKTPITNLFLVGHWVSLSAGEYGIPTAAYTGLRASRMIIKAKAP